MTGRVLETAASVPADGPLAEALAVRSRLMDLTEASHTAALTPREPGGLPHDLRAALACRMTRIAGTAALAGHYAALAPDHPLANPDAPGVDAREAAILAYVDKVTRSPRDAVPGDIDALRDAGVEEGDIVRLAGLVAFVNYQLRVAVVLEKLGAGA
jgi:uncharacterized protein YciW